MAYGLFNSFGAVPLRPLQPIIHSNMPNPARIIRLLSLSASGGSRIFLRGCDSVRNGCDPMENGRDPMGNGCDPMGNGCDQMVNGCDPMGNGCDPMGMGVSDGEWMRSRSNNAI